MVATESQNNETRTIHEWISAAQRQGGSVDIHRGKRQELRRAWLAMLDVHVLTGHGEGTFVYATARDISAGGLSLTVRKAISVGACIGIYLSGHDDGATGIVRHCTETLGGFIVGVEFTECISKPEATPRHITPETSPRISRPRSPLAWLR